jgi:multisubunit Na+/H+ antiporter MnhG subunit
MPSVGALIFFAIVGSFICARVRVAGGAVVFALIALVLFVTTPLGAGLPGAVGSFMSTVSHATDPVLDGSASRGDR